MYKGKRPNQVDVNQRITNLFTNGLTNKYTNNHLKYFDNLKKELEARQTRQSMVLFRKKLKESEDRVNRTGELSYIRGEVSKYDNRFPILTLENLHNRAKKLKDLGAQIADKKDYENEMKKIEYKN
jgi:hypothetical protein